MLIKSFKKEALIVILGSFSITVYLAPFLYRLSNKLFNFRLTEDYGIVSWVTVNSYPIGSHIYYYVLAFTASIVFALFFQALWIATSFTIAKLWRINIRQALRIDAYTYFFGILGVLIFFIDDSYFFKILPFFISLIFISKFFAVSIYKRLVKSGWVNSLATISYAYIKNFVKVRKLYVKKRVNPIFKKLLFFLIIPVIIYLLLYNPGLTQGIDLLHEGEHLDPSQKLLEGKIIYKDIYIVHGVLHDVLIPYLGINLFGKSLEGYRKLYSPRDRGPIAPLGYISFYFLCIFLFRRKLTVILAMLLLFCAIEFLDISGRHAFGILSLVFVISFIDKEKLLKLFIAGILTAVSLMYSTEFGGTTLVSLSIFLLFYCIISKRPKVPLSLRYFAIYVSGFIIGISPFIIYLIKNKALIAYLELTVFDSLKFRPCIWGTPFILNHEIKYFPIIVYLVGVLWHMRDVLYAYYDRTKLKSMAVLICGIFYFFPLLITPDAWHMRYASFLAYIIIFIPAESFFLYLRDIFIFGKRKLWQRDFTYNVISMLCIVIISVWVIDKFSPKDMIIKLTNRINRSYVTPGDVIKLNLERVGNISVSNRKLALEVQAVVSHIEANTEKGDYIYVFGNKGLYYFLTDRKNPTKYSIAEYASSTRQQEEVVQDLIKYKPKYIISGYDPTLGDFQNKTRFPIIWSYINKYYYSDFKYKDVDILKYQE